MGLGRGRAERHARVTVGKAAARLGAGDTPSRRSDGSLNAETGHDPVKATEPAVGPGDHPSRQQSKRVRSAAGGTSGGPGSSVRARAIPIACEWVVGPEQLPRSPSGARQRGGRMALPDGDGGRHARGRGHRLDSHTPEASARPVLADSAMGHGPRAAREAAQRRRDRGRPDLQVGDALTMYVQEIRSIPLLSSEQERDLGGRAASGDADAWRALVLGNVRLVLMWARRFRGHGLDMEDLIQEGNLGLMRAAQSFDPDQGTQFSTYASWWIRQAIHRSIADRGRTVRLPIHIGKAIHQMRKAEDALRQALGREPSPAEIGTGIGVTARRVEELRLAVARTLSMEGTGEEEWSDLCEIVPDPQAVDPQEMVWKHLRSRALDEALSHLNPRLQTVLRLRHGLDPRGPLTLEQVGKILGVNRRRSHQLEHKAYRILRAPVNIRRLMACRVSRD